MTFIFAAVNFPQFFIGEPYPDYNLHVKQELQNCNNINILDNGINILLSCKSYQIFGDYRVFSYIESLLIIPIAYLLATKISNYSSVGLFTVFSIISSFTINQFAVSAAYPELWSLCFLSSLFFLLCNKTKFALPLLVLGIIAKPLTLVYSPILIYIAYQSMPKQKLFIISSMIILVSSVIIYLDGLHEGVHLMLNIPDFATPFIQLILILPMQYLVIASIPMTLFLLFKSRSLGKQKKILLFSLSCLIIVFFALPTFTNMSNTSYRMIPFMTILYCANGHLIVEKLQQLIKHK